ncbi:cyclin-D5-2-like [Solanum pennellii]|uniref:Cyclin-D5-2-like n=1 Tax=Solanum pennellii TaxID=28526 RepID=A0ABM1V855_SOLPN|nr:cyclin-D5-2-like [Solanum pennellii]
MAEEDWDDIFTNLQMSAYKKPISRRIQRFAARQFWAEEKTDIGRDNQDYVENMFRIEETIENAELTNQLSSRTTQHPWLLEARHTAIHHIVHTGGPFGVKKVTVYTAVVYVDRFLSSMPIQNERFNAAKLLGIACLYLACEQLEEDEVQPGLSDYSSSTKCCGRIITEMRNRVVEQFRGIVTFVTPIQFIKYFLSRFCRDISRKVYAKSKTIEIIMSTIGDLRLMSLRAFVVGAAAALLASNTNILTHEMIRDEINALPQNWLIPLDEVCSCYNRLLETNMHKLQINLN